MFQPQYSPRKKLDHTNFYAERFGGAFFLTVCCQQRGLNQLCLAKISDSILETVDRYHQAGSWWCQVFLLMPDHCHALISVPLEASLSDTVRNFKRITARITAVKWQRGFFDHRLRHDESSSEKYDYIMANPFRAGLIAEKESWLYVFTP